MFVYWLHFANKRPAFYNKNPFNVLLFKLIFVSHKVSKIVNLLSPDGFFQPQNTPKFVFGRGSAMGAYDAPQTP